VPVSRQRYTTAARFYAEAFAEEPSLATETRTAHRYNAACAAALAAAGQGKDAADLGAVERAYLHRRALTWLRADLDTWTVLEQRLPGARPGVRQKFQHWQKDPDLAGLREPARIASLPAEERPACLELWADVAALLKRTQGPQ
jgi:hypothetical protein